MALLNKTRYPLEHLLLGEIFEIILALLAIFPCLGEIGQQASASEVGLLRVVKELDLFTG